MMEWQPMASCPLDGTKVDLWDRAGYRWADVKWDHLYWIEGVPSKDKGWTGGCIDYSQGPGPDPVAWMPLPKPPAM